MALNDTITLSLEGEIGLDDFATAMLEFRRIVDGLTKAIRDKDSVAWIVDNLSHGSATVAVRGESANTTAVETIAHAYLTVGRSLAQNERVPYPKVVQNAAAKIAGLIDGRISSVSFQTREDDAVIRRTADRLRIEPLPLVTSFGAVEGIVQTLSNRKGLRFFLYDTIFDKPVSCYLDTGQEAVMRDVWGRRALVEGFVSRDPESGRPVSIRRISHVEIVPDPLSGAYLRARGILPLRAGDEKPEERIRRFRDA